MATLELSLDEDVAVSPVKRTRRLGPLFWAAIAWIILVFAAAGLVGVLPLPSPTDMDMLERRAPASALHCIFAAALKRWWSAAWMCCSHFRRWSWRWR